MFVNPFVAGVLSVVFVELAAFFVYAAYSYYKGSK